MTTTLDSLQARPHVELASFARDLNQNRVGFDIQATNTHPAGSCSDIGAFARGESIIIYYRQPPVPHAGNAFQENFCFRSNYRSLARFDN
jgi:hypothetical protein